MCSIFFCSCEKQKYTVAVDHRDTPLQVAAMHNWNRDWSQTQIEMKVIREAIYKSIRNDANYSAEEMKKDVVKQFQDQYLLKVIMFVMIHVVFSIIDNWNTAARALLNVDFSPILSIVLQPEVKEWLIEIFSPGCRQWPVFPSWLPHLSV